MKRIGFLSFGHWQAIPGSVSRTASDALLQTVELAVAAEEIGIDNASVRVHHFVPQLSAPFPLLAAMAARTSRIELGTGVIDLRYENPLYFAEEAAVTDLIAAGRLQLGVSRGSPEPALHGAAAFGYTPRVGETDADLAHDKLTVILQALQGAGVVDADPRMTGGAEGTLAIEPRSPGLERRIWWGSGTRSTARWTAKHGLNLMSSTLLTEDTGVPFDQLQAEQIREYRKAWAQAGHAWTPRVSVSRSVLPITTDEDRRYFGGDARDAHDEVGYIGDEYARFGRSYAGEPDRLVEELGRDEAVREADTLLLTVPNQLGVGYCTRLLETVVTQIAPALGWR